MRRLLVAILTLTLSALPARAQDGAIAAYEQLRSKTPAVPPARDCRSRPCR